ncbi:MULTISPECIES: PerC family transcriptional regulator [unclassified Serratia (in: enterobacteria)]|uniref:PerC family transcriptional regulator n=1 Tax=unclassified Serratia (in: enterobacteria) TaxID=2647522 RepID=UPI003B42A787
MLSLAECIQEAERLETAGLWRRAERHWLLAYDLSRCPEQRAALSQRRSACVSRGGLRGSRAGRLA